MTATHTQHEIRHRSRRCRSHMATPALMFLSAGRARPSSTTCLSSAVRWLPRINPQHATPDGSRTFATPVDAIASLLRRYTAGIHHQLLGCARNGCNDDLIAGRIPMPQAGPGTPRRDCPAPEGVLRGSPKPDQCRRTKASRRNAT